MYALARLKIRSREKDTSLNPLERSSRGFAASSSSPVKNETIREHFGAKRRDALSGNGENISGAFPGRG